MAVASSFDESNSVLGPPPGMTEDQVYSLSVWQGMVYTEGLGEAPTTISCWKLTKEELVEINRTGRIWLGILGPMPPAWVSGTKPFSTEPK